MKVIAPIVALGSLLSLIPVALANDGPIRPVLEYAYSVKLYTQTLTTNVTVPGGTRAGTYCTTFRFNS